MSLPAPDDFKTRDASSYDPVVDSFDALVSRFCAPFAERIVALANPAPAERILDVGCGTGIVALQVAPAVRQGRVLGVDLSDGMLRTARVKAAATDFAHLDFQMMDAESLQVDDQSFDAVLSLFALTHFPDPLAALRQMYRVLRPGGRLVIGVGAAPLLLSPAGATAALRRFERAWYEWRGRQLTAPHFLDALTLRHLGDTAEPEETSWAGDRLGRAAAVRRLVVEAGFQDSVASFLEQRPTFASAKEFWEIQATWSSISRKRLLGASADQVDAVRRDFDRASNEVLARGGRLVYPLASFYVTARRP